MASSSHSRPAPMATPVSGSLATHYDHAGSVHDEGSFLESFLHHGHGKPTLYKLPPQAPIFLINSLDGAFTPYMDRSPASSPTEEMEDPFVTQDSPMSSPVQPSTSIRSRAASLVCQKILLHQDQMLANLTAAWNRKHPPTPVGALMLPTPHETAVLPRRTRPVISLDSAVSIPTPRLSLCDGEGTVVDVDKWKHEALEEQTRRDAVIAWFGRLTLADRIAGPEPPVEWPESSIA